MNTISEQEVIPNYNSIKIAIWLYFLLWIFEGALRKWILPSLATPLLVVRDPIAIYIIVKAINTNLKFINGYIVFSFIITILAFVITLTFGHSDLLVGLYGARIMLFHFPLIFIIGSVFVKEDVLKMGQVLLVINLLMTVIVYLQFSSPQTAFINVGLGGEGSAGFSGSMGYSRPPGTFSFTTGLTSYYILVSVFVFYFWLSKESCSKILLISSTLALIIALPLTVSRTAVGGVVLVGFFSFIGSSTSFKSIFRLLFVVLLIISLFVLLQKTTSVFNLGTEVFINRVEEANDIDKEQNTSFVERALEGFTEPIVNLVKSPLFVGNLGMGTNAGSQMLTGKVKFLISESELGRLAGEQGLVLGGGLIALRLLLALSFFFRSITLPSTYKLLPLAFCGSSLFLITQGQWAQPSMLGCSIVAAGLLDASINLKKKSQ